MKPNTNPIETQIKGYRNHKMRNILTTRTGRRLPLGARLSNYQLRGADYEANL